MTTTTTRRAMLAIGAALPALATSQALALSSSWDAAPDAAMAAARAAEIVRVLRTYHVRAGWQIDEDAAGRALAWFNGRVTGRVSDDEPMTDEGMAAMRFLNDHGQSLDWVFTGDTTGMICRSAAHSKQAGRSVALEDPIFAAIEAHHEAKEEADARYDDHGPFYNEHVGDRLGTDTPTDTEHPDFVRTRERWDAASDIAMDKLRALAATKPTTIAGVAEAAAYLADHLADHEPDDYMDAEDAPSFSVAFMDVIAESLASLAEGGAA